MKIGLLIPDSSFYPYIGVDFFEGFKYKLPSEIEIIEAETKTASPSELQTAARKLILKDNVDLITGWIGYKGITALLPLLKQTHTPIIMCNGGETPVIQADKDPYVIHCSLSIFESAYLITKWAIQQFGTEYSNLVSFYDAGYPLSSAVDLAAKEYKGRINQTQVVQKDSDKNYKFFLEKVFENPGSFIFSSFSGWDAIEMMKELRNYDQLPDVPIVASPMFVDQAVLDQEAIKDVYSVNNWMQRNGDSEHLLDQYFLGELHRKLSPFGILGYESALILSHCLENNWKPKSGIEKHLYNSEINTPRGSLTFNPLFNRFECGFSLFKTVSTNNMESYSNELIQSIEIDDTDRRLCNSITEESSGWLNSYLCV